MERKTSRGVGKEHALLNCVVPSLLSFMAVLIFTVTLILQVCKGHTGYAKCLSLFLQHR